MMKRHLFRGKDPRETLAKVRESLGPDAVIFSTRRVEGAAEGEPFVVEAAAWGESLAEGGPAIPGGGAGAPAAARAPVTPLREARPAPAAGGVPPAILSPVFAELVESGLSEDAAREVILQAAGGLSLSERDSAEPLRERVAGLLTFLFEAAQIDEEQLRSE
ncbi:MAG: hypothetical protein AABZ64_05105, partial [Nitrospinota bacterium]